MLHSRLFRNDPRLQSCAVQDSAHLVPGSNGAPVGLVQLALIALGAPAISAQELRVSHYGTSTAAAVLAYKRSRAIINRSYQQQPDDIVGRMTIVQLDQELAGIEGHTTGVPQWHEPLTDSAPAFALRAALVDAMKGPGVLRDPTHWAFTGAPSAAGMNESGPAAMATLLRHSAGAVRRAAQHIGIVDRTPRTKLGPDPGGLREGICRDAMQTPVVGLHFADQPVSSCWGRNRSAETQQPMAQQNPVVTHWCGIFATWLWWLGGLEVHWTDGVGPCKTGGKRLKTSSTLAMLAPGDILVEAWGYVHHLLVLSIACDRSSAEVIEGNAGLGKPHQTVVRRREYKLPSSNERHYFYSVDSWRNPAVNYGYNIVPGPPAPKKP